MAYASPLDPLARMCELYRALKARSGWFSDPNAFHFAAVTLATTRGAAETLAEAVERTAARLKERAGWFGALHSSVRYPLAAMLVRNGDDADAFTDEVERVRGLIRDLGLWRGGTYDAIAAYLLRSHRRGITAREVERLRDMYREMKRNHWWLTGTEDYPYCALFALQDRDPADIARRLEDLYARLLDAGCSRGNALQRVTHILYLNPKPEAQIATRFVDLHIAFREAGVRMWTCDWDELALLTYPVEPVQQIVRGTLVARDAMLGQSPSPGRILAFTLGASIAFLKLCGDLPAVLDPKSLVDLQQIIEAQEAAAGAGAG